MRAMSRASLHRRLVALVAAYGVALQGLFAAVAAVSPAAALDAVVCPAPASAPAGHAGGGAPPHRPDCPFCPLACGSAVTPPPPAASLVLIAAVGDVMPAMPQPQQRPMSRIVLRDGLARAPPR